MEKKRYCVIGGGWSGLYALKYLLEENVDVKLFECESNLGGIWFYKEREGGVYQSTHVTSSKTYLHASDFPLPRQFPYFPKHNQILDYLNSYADHFHLWSHIHFQSHINHIELHENNQWKIRYRHNQIEINEIFHGLVIATGQHQIPNDLRNVEPFNKFSGMMSHSISYKKPDENIHFNKRILIVGGGETASDLAVELSKESKCLYMSIRHGQWFQERLLGDQPADILFTKSLALFGFYDNLWVQIGWNYFIRPFWGNGGTGIRQWMPKTKLFHGFINKSRDVVQKIAYGMVIPKRKILDINKNLVQFDDDDQSVEIDHILFCTGYKWSHPFFNDYLEKESSIECLYELIFPLNLPNVAFVGTARPVFGSIPSIAELQARRIAQVFSGRSNLPSRSKMSIWLNNYWKRHKEIYPFEERLTQLVNQFEYTDFLAQQINIKPHLFKLFLFQPWKFYKIYFGSPWTPFLYRLNGIESEDEKLAYERHLECIPRKDQSFSIYLRFINIIYAFLLFFILFPFIIFIYLFLI